MRVIIAVLVTLLAFSSFAAPNKRADTEKMARERDLKECREYVFKSMEDAHILKMLATDDFLREYTSNVVEATCMLEAIRNQEKKNHYMKEMIREAEKRARNKKNAARASKTM